MSNRTFYLIGGILIVAVLAIGYLLVSESPARGGNYVEIEKIEPQKQQTALHQNVTMPNPSTDPSGDDALIPSSITE